MQFFKNTLLIVMLCSINAMDARTRAGVIATPITTTQAVQEQTAPVRPVIINQPVMQMVQEQPIIGKVNEEKLIGELIDERMEELGDFEYQIKLLNELSKRLTKYGIEKQLLQESKDNLINCFNAIIKISDVFGKENTYPTLTRLIEQRLLVIAPTVIGQRQIMPIMPQQPVVKVQPIIKKTGDIEMYLVPTDPNALRKLDLCPLFTQQEISKLTAQELKDFRSQGYTEDEIKSFTFQGVSPHYSVFNEKKELLLGGTRSEFETKDVAVNAPCNVQLGRYGNWSRVLMQLKSLDQFELAAKTGFSVAMCGGLSLNNGRLIRNYVLTGNEQSLYNVHNITDAAGFLRKIKIGDWLNAEVLRGNLVNLTKELGVDGIDVSVVSTVSLFDSNLNKQPGFGLFGEDEFAYVQNVKKNIQEGLKKDNYVHVVIIGNEETVEEALGHYFCFAIIKAGNEIQYVVLDTVPSTYHLQAGSHERDRLMFVIDNIERGNSTIKVANIRVKRLQILEEERKASLKK